MWIDLIGQMPRYNLSASLLDHMVASFRVETGVLCVFLTSDGKAEYHVYDEGRDLFRSLTFGEYLFLREMANV